MKRHESRISLLPNEMEGQLNLNFNKKHKDQDNRTSSRFKKQKAGNKTNIELEKNKYLLFLLKKLGTSIRKKLRNRK